MAIAGFNSQVLVTSQPAIALSNEPTTDAGDHKTYTITNQSKRYLDKSTAVVVQTSPDGTTWTTVTTGFVLYTVNARVVFTVAQSGTTQVRLASGKYFAVAQIGEAASADFNAKMDTAETTVFNTTGTKSFIPTLLNGTLKCNTFWANPARVNNLIARDTLVVSFQTPTGNRYEGYCFVSDSNLKTDPKSAVTDDVSFMLTDQFFAN